MWKFLIALLALLIAAPVAAQPIQGHPQKQAYASSAEYLPLNDQCWIDDPDPLKAGHVHIIARPALYMRVQDWGTFDVPFTLQLHNISGRITAVQGEHIRRVRWDATGSTTLPILDGGGPNSLVEFSGVATVDHTLPDPNWDFLGIFKFPVHGWAEDRLEAILAIQDGRRLDTYNEWSVYSAIDPSAPEKPAPEQGRPGVHIRTRCVMWSADPTQTAGEVITEISDYLPFGPQFAPFTTIANAYNYTAPANIVFAPELFEVRKDPHLHQGIPGILLRSLVVGPAMNKQFLGPFTLDPAAFGTGEHTAMVTWTQPLPTSPARSISAVVVFPFSVGAGVPPPLATCDDPMANNIGQPLPCTYTAPPLFCEDPNAPNFHGPLPCLPPVEHVFVPFTPFFEQKDGVFQVCNGAAGSVRLCKIIG